MYVYNIFNCYVVKTIFIYLDVYAYAIYILWFNDSQKYMF